uniref:Uncharacterized protein n=1 Tax=Setaria viridis TaxID=4556 RepID=A0A4U6VEI9_SETVI|nr:hypothetical protein SEVIR_3G290900v2 [Setaria viridis]
MIALTFSNPRPKDCLLLMGMAPSSSVRLSQLSGASSHPRSIWCRHQHGIYPMRFCRTNNSSCERNNHGAVAILPSMNSKALQEKKRKSVHLGMRRAHGGEGDRGAKPWAVHNTHLHFDSTTCQHEMP